MPTPHLRHTRTSGSVIPAHYFRHTRACRGYLDATSTTPTFSRHPHPLPAIPAPISRHSRAPFSLHSRALSSSFPPPSGNRPRAASNAAPPSTPSFSHHLHLRHTRALIPSYPRLPRSLPLARTGVSRREQHQAPLSPSPFPAIPAPEPPPITPHRDTVPPPHQHNGPAKTRPTAAAPPTNSEQIRTNLYNPDHPESPSDQIRRSQNHPHTPRPSPNTPDQT